MVIAIMGLLILLTHYGLYAILLPAIDLTNATLVGRNGAFARHKNESRCEKNDISA